MSDATKIVVSDPLLRELEEKLQRLRLGQTVDLIFGDKVFRLAMMGRAPR